MKQWIIPLLVLTFIGCAAMQHRSAGDKFLKKQQYKQAIKEYKQALEIDPKYATDEKFNLNYKKAKYYFHLMKADTAKVRRDYQEAIENYIKAIEVNANEPEPKKALKLTRYDASNSNYKKGMDFVKDNDLYRAINSFEKSIHFNPDNLKAKDALGNAIALKKEREEKAEKHYKAALIFFSERNWDDASKTIDLCLYLNPNHIAASSKQKEIKRIVGKVDRLFSEAENLFESKLWPEAIKAYETVILESPFYEKAKGRIQDSRTNIKRSNELLEKGRAAARKNQWENAIVALRKSVDISPTNNAAVQFLNDSPLEAAKYFCEMGDKFYAKKHKKDAENHYEKALIYVSTFKPALSGISNIFYDSGVKYLGKKMYGNAFLEFKKAQYLNPKHDYSVKNLQTVYEELIRQINYRFAILPFKNSTREPGISDLISEEVIHEVMQNRPKHTEIVDRVHLSTILEEQKLSSAGIIEDATKISFGKIRGVDALIVANVVEYNFKTNEYAESKSKRYKSGTRRVPNPAYETALREYEDAQDDYDDAKEEERRLKRSGNSLAASLNSLAAAGSRIVLSVTERELRETPRYLNESVHSYWSFNVYNVQKQGVVRTGVRVIDTTTGKVLFSDTITKDISVRDRYIDRPNRDAGVYEDRLELPSDFDIKKDLIKESTNDISKKLVDFLSNFGLKYYFMAEQAVKREDTDTAIENYIRFLISDPKSAMQQEGTAIEFIRKNRGCIFKDGQIEKIVFSKQHAQSVYQKDKDTNETTKSGVNNIQEKISNSGPRRNNNHPLEKRKPINSDFSGFS